MGFFYIFKTRLKEESTPKAPILTGMGRAGLEFIFNLIMILVADFSFSYIVFLLLVRLVMSLATVALCYFDFLAARNKKLRYLMVIAILLHASINAGIYALEQDFIASKIISPDSFSLIVSAITILIALFVYKLHGIAVGTHPGFQYKESR